MPQDAWSQSILDLSTGAFSFEEDDDDEEEDEEEPPEPEPDPADQADDSGLDGDDIGPLPGRAGAPGGGSLTAAGCTDADIEARAAEIDAIVRANVPPGAGGTAVLAAEWAAINYIEMYERCYRPEFDQVLGELRGVLTWAEQQKRALGIQGGTFP